MDSTLSAILFEEDGEYVLEWRPSSDEVYRWYYIFCDDQLVEARIHLDNFASRGFVTFDVITSGESP